MHSSRFPAQDQQHYQMEMESFLRTYFQLYDPTSPCCIFKSPIFPDPAKNFPLLIAQSVEGINDRDGMQLRNVINIAEVTIGRNQSFPKAHLIIGLDILKSKLDNDFKEVEAMENVAASEIEKPLREIETKLEGELRAKAKKIRERNYSLMEKLLRIEEKLQFFAKKSNSFNIKVAEASEAESAVGEISSGMTGIDSRAENLRYFVDHQTENSIAASGEKSQLSNEKLLGVLKRPEKNQLLDYLEKMKASLTALNANVAECEADMRDVCRAFDRPFQN